MDKKKNKPRYPAPKRAKAPLRRAFAPMRGTGIFREVRAILGWIRKKQNLGTRAKRARVPLRRAFVPTRGRALYSGVYVRRAAARSGVSAALWRVLAEGANPAVRPGETYCYGCPPVGAAFHVYLSAVRPDYRLDYRHTQAVSVSFRGIVRLKKLRHSLLVYSAPRVRKGDFHEVVVGERAHRYVSAGVHRLHRVCGEC